MDTLSEWVSVSDAKAYLSQIRLIDSRINDGLEDLERLNSIATKVTSALDGEMVSGTRNPDKMTDIVAKIIELKEDINSLVDKFVDTKREATELLSKVKNPIHYKILYSRYVLYKTWEQIAAEINFSYQWTSTSLRDSALLEFAEIMRENGVTVDRN